MELDKVKLPEPGITTVLVLDEVGRRIPMRLVGTYYTADQMREYADARIAEECTNLRRVYEAARRILRYNGLDKERTIKAFIELDDAIEDVKRFDSGLENNEG